MPGQSISEAMFIPAFKGAAAEGAVVELKMRLLAGKIPALQGTLIRRCWRISRPV